MNRRQRITVMAAIAAITGLGIAAPASAAPSASAPAAAVHAASGGYNCNESTGTWHDRNSAGGFCDGQGPHWSYQTHAECKDGTNTSGTRRWAGDRRWSYAYCGRNGGLSHAWVNMYYDGDYTAKSMDIL